MTRRPVTVILGSAGRRLYLIDWFREAFRRAGVQGEIVVAESDETSAAFTAGDRGWLLPRYEDPCFEGAFWSMIDSVTPDIYIPLNDYEIARLSHGIAATLRSRDILVPGVDPQWLEVCTDKLTMARELTDADVPTPETVTGDDEDGLGRMVARHDDFIVKHRYGSGSSGVELATADTVAAAVLRSAETAPRVVPGQEPAAAVVVQPLARGREHGVDIVCGLSTPGSFRGVLARRKHRMRAGETDKAVSVDAQPFHEIGRRLAAALGCHGLVDTDMFLDDEGNVTVIDINPRFGGGYPFVHLAGADVPSLYVQEVLGIAARGTELSYEPGVVSAKFEAARVTGREGGTR